MLNVTYINGIDNSQYAIIAPLTSRIMKKILSNDKMLNVEFNDTILLSRIFFNNYKYSININDNRFKEEVFIDLLIKLYKEIISTINTEYVLISAVGVNDLLLTSEILKSNKKVIIGGPITKAYSTYQIRHLLSNYCKDYLNNLIIIRPYIGLNTSIYNMILDWKDIEDVEYDCSNLLEVDDDNFINNIPTLSSFNLDIKPLLIILNTQCSWGNCSFCVSPNQFKKDFTKSMNIDNFIQKTILLAKKYNLKLIHIVDPIIIFNKNNIRIIEGLKKAGLIIMTFSSILLLKQQKYFDMTMKYIDIIKIGGETFDNFSLKQLNKNFTYEDILLVFNRFIEYKKNNKKISSIYLHLLIDVPVYNEDSIKINYIRITKLTLELYKNKIPIILLANKLMINPFVPIAKSKYIKLNHKENSTLFNTYKRIDCDGNILPRDFEIIHPTIFNFVTKNKSYNFQYLFDDLMFNNR